MALGYYPHPRQYMIFRESYIDNPDSWVYDVPAGKAFVLTALGIAKYIPNDDYPGQHYPLPCVFSAIFYPGMPDFQSGNGYNGYDMIGGLSGSGTEVVETPIGRFRKICNYIAMPPCCVFHEGTTLGVNGGQSGPGPSTDNDARIIGYLVDVPPGL